MSEKLKIVMAQVNLLVGDIRGNTKLHIDYAQRAINEYRADIVVFPELSLTGYPPEDLLLRPSLELRINRAMERLLQADLDIFMVVGHPQFEDNKLYNGLSVIKGRQILASYRKQCLPNFQVFDEKRYFTPGDSATLLQIKNIPIAFTICQDLWEDGPISQLKDSNAKLLININGSPFHINKTQQRKELIGAKAKDAKLPIVYVNHVGGQDELVFDGSSMVLDVEGECKVLAASFKECLLPIEFENPGEGKDLELLTLVNDGCKSEEESIYKALVLGVRDYVFKNGFKGVVLGLSGGIDSALTLAIAVDAIGGDKVEAVMMPFQYTSEMSLQDAQLQANTLGVNYRVIPIGSIYESFMSSLQGEFQGLDADVTEQNLQARCRGVLLMAISNKKGSLVLTTGNKSEIAVGYTTLYGDMAGGFDVLKDVPKMLVYRLANYRNNSYTETSKEIIPQRVIDRPPSAELAPDQIDQDNLPPYSVLDEILELYVEQDQSAHAIVAKGFPEQIVKRVLRLVDLNEYKRRQSPVGVRLTQRAFGRDRRYPITSGWELGE